APDTLRVGRKVIPCHVRRMRRSGSQEWGGDASGDLSHAVLVQTTWRNEWIPITGYARRVLELSSEQLHRGAPADSGGAARADPPRPAATAGAGFYRAEIALLDLGTDAVPETTQVPEPAPQGPAPRPKMIIK